MSQREPEKQGSLSHSHMKIEEIIAYHEGRLTETARRKLEEHLETCTACTELLTEFATFEPTFEPRDQAKGRNDADRVLTRIRRERFQRVAAVASTFLTLTIGVFIWSQRRFSYHSETPQFEIIIGLRGPVREIEIPQRTRNFMLCLAGDSIVAGERYQVRTTDREGRSIAPNLNLIADAQGVIQLVLDAHIFPSGIYELAIRPERLRPGQASLVVPFKITQTP